MLVMCKAGQFRKSIVKYMYILKYIYILVTISNIIFLFKIPGEKTLLLSVELALFL